MAHKKNSKKIVRVRRRTHEGVDKVIDNAEDVKEKIISIKESIAEYIQKNSKKSVLIATGIGAVIGAIFTTKLMRRKD